LAPAPGDFFSIRKNIPYADPVLKSVAESYDNFLVNFTKGDNHKKCYILHNEAFTLGLRKKNTLTKDNFGEMDANATQNLYNLTYSDIAQENGIKSIESIEQICGVPIGRILYRDLTGLVNASQIKFGNTRLLSISP
jgi:hypothetical protein